MNKNIIKKEKISFSIIEKLILIYLSLLLILNNGIQAAVIPPGIPIGILGEIIVLPLIIFYIFNGKLKLNYLTCLVLLSNFLTIFSIIYSFNLYGLQSIRSATYSLDTNYILIGSIISQNKLKFLNFPKISWNILYFGSIYFLSLPFKSFLVNFSPVFNSLTGYKVPLFFNFYVTASLVSITFLFSEFFFPIKNTRNIIPKLIAAVSTFFVLTFYTARYNYFVLIILLIYSVYFKPNKIGKMMIFIISAIVILNLLFFLGIGINSRVSNITSLDFFYNHFLSSFGIQNDYFSDGGLQLRLDWWLKALEKLFATPVKSLFGLGQGIPLTDFINNNNILIRDLHNSYIQILVRDGIIGTTIFILIHIKLIKNFMNNIKLTKDKTIINNFYHTSFIFVLSIAINALMQNALENPCKAIPYYFVWGIIGSYKLKTKKNY